MVRIQLHGRFAVVVDGRSVAPELPGRRGRMLVALLADPRHAVVDRTSLLELLWHPAVPGPGAAATFTALLSKVRTVIAPAEIRGRGSLQLVLPPGSIVDTAAAEAALHAAEAAEARADWRRTWTQALSTLFVTQRPFLPDLDDPWVEDRRSALAQAHQRALRCYAEACLRLGGGEVAAAERAARELVALDPHSESGYCLLMRALSERGDRGGALDVFAQLRRVLREDLGASPGPTAAAVHQRLLGP